MITYTVGSNMSDMTTFNRKVKKVKRNEYEEYLQLHKKY